MPHFKGFSICNSNINKYSKVIITRVLYITSLPHFKGFSICNSNINKYPKVITRVPKSTQDEMESAVSAAKAAYQTWSKTSVLSRQQVMLRYQHIIRNNMVWPYKFET